MWAGDGDIGIDIIKGKTRQQNVRRHQKRLCISKKLCLFKQPWKNIGITLWKFIGIDTSFLKAIHNSYRVFLGCWCLWDLLNFYYCRFFFVLWIYSSLPIVIFFLLTSKFGHCSSYGIDVVLDLFSVDIYIDEPVDSFCHNII